MQFKVKHLGEEPYTDIFHDDIRLRLEMPMHAVFDYGYQVREEFNPKWIDGPVTVFDGWTGYVFHRPVAIVEDRIWSGAYISKNRQRR